jgi:hypothetical protein
MKADLDTRVGGEWSASRPGRFTSGEKAPGTHWIGGWVSPKTGLDDIEGRKILPLPGIEPHLLGRPAHSLVAIPTELSQIIHIYTVWEKSV